jgi:hypothetical protein
MIEQNKLVNADRAYVVAYVSVHCIEIYYVLGFNTSRLSAEISG